MSTQTQDVIVSGLPDLADAPFGSEIGIDAARVRADHAADRRRRGPAGLRVQFLDLAAKGQTARGFESRLPANCQHRPIRLVVAVGRAADPVAGT
jgi:hypothetical protein